MSHAYQQLLLEEESKQYLTINTHRGLFRYNRLPFGVYSAPAIFQRVMESTLQGIPHTVVYLDDILVTGRTHQEHLWNLQIVLRQLKQAGLRLKREKCQFLTKAVQYLGYRIDQDGLHPTDDKIKAIREAPAPRNVAELRSYLGLLNYYGKFLPNLATTLSPLYDLLQKERTWTWSKRQDDAFTESKKWLHSGRLLVHYDPSRELVLCCDASPYGVGAVLCHRRPDGTDQPIAFSSRTLSKAEQGYSQLEKEGLAVIVGIKKFHQYLYGREFTTYTDHKPLLGLLGEKKAISPMTSARIQRWILFLAGYRCTLCYRPGSENGNADALSRLPLPELGNEEETPEEVIMTMKVLATTPIRATDIERLTGKDPTLARVRNFVWHGWPKERTDDPEIQPYLKRRDELSIVDRCILWGSREVVPPTVRKTILDELHEGHPGISRMRSLARSYVW